ncbi:hypothetical protein FDG2_4846 [Candidatus Protofrankia californiensis]|uniref:Uncharacterized protein n=1 Tax=Candidatus Protofrankia californiensis TaxID=1839754 RepID=A0A1C3P8X9_9ACTN|nr:hypothetical protein FDG2_4846 [Candidatus Protofrankia californiensis]
MNCFEQLPDPGQVLLDAARLLEPGGHLVIRTPNAAFIRFAYTRCPPTLGRRLLAGTNLGGVAYAVSYSTHALTRLITAAGFTGVAVRGREHASPARRAFTSTPLAWQPGRRALYRLASAPGMAGPAWPWMDITATRHAEPRQGSDSVTSQSARVTGAAYVRF